jgi:hydrogenase nickel incorporation protein HypA/HybF
MHELPVIESILNIVMKHAELNQVQKIVSITLEVGELSDLEAEWMQHYFNFLSNDTLAEGAELRVTYKPIVLQCSQCHHSLAVKKEQMGAVACPSCGCEDKFDLVSGQEYFIKEMEVL